MPSRDSSLLELARSFPRARDLINSTSNLDTESARLHQLVTRAFEENSEWRGAVADLRRSLDGPGYALVDWSDSVDAAADQENFLALATVISASLGMPHKMVPRLGLWQELGVNLEAEPYRFAGIGHNPHHIDGVNVQFPPDLVVFACIRPDPLGGGVSLLSRLDRAVASLEPETARILLEADFEEGSFFGMHGVGSELRPFKVLSEHATDFTRVTGKLLPGMSDGPEKQALSELLQALGDRQDRIALEKGQLLLFNQRLVSHGREPLGDDQASVPAAKRRLIRQSYIRMTF